MIASKRNLLCDRTKARSAAFNLFELLLVLVVVVLLVSLLMPSISRPNQKAGAARINCLSNLKQVGLAFRMWANEHEGQFPMAVSGTQTGSMEYVQTGEVFRHFQVMSNELYSPKILICSADPGRVKATTFGLEAARIPFASNTNTSYLVGVDAHETQPNMILSGDRNVTGGVVTNGGVMLFHTNRGAAGWTSEMHNRAGNIGLADGSASQVTENPLRRQMRMITNEVIRLAIPLTR